MPDSRMRALAAALLGVDPLDAGGLIELRRGLRTVALLATPPGQTHAFSAECGRVLVKFYKGDWSTAGGRQYHAFHAAHSRQLEVLSGNNRIQRSLAAGIFEKAGSRHPYAILEYIPGTDLADRLGRRNMDLASACDILRDILLEIWIPLWSGGLRFKDCHPGNFVVAEDGRVCMIDAEQMRKDAMEIIHSPSDWTQRNRHEEAGLRRLPGLVTRLICSARQKDSVSSVNRAARDILHRSRLPEALRELGRDSSCSFATEATHTCLKLIGKRWRNWGFDAKDELPPMLLN